MEETVAAGLLCEHLLFHPHRKVELKNFKPSTIKPCRWNRIRPFCVGFAFAYHHSSLLGTPANASPVFMSPVCFGWRVFAFSL
jgi:hypothetical protein